MYSLLNYEQMIDDKVRMDAYVAALRRAVKPDSVVLDIGAGPGIMSLLACRYGARHVYAIEPDNAICVAQENAQANGLTERITFIQDLSTRVVLPERADILISDLRGVLPLFTSHLDSIIHARENFLNPDGIMIPQKDTLCVALTDSPRTKNVDESSRWDREQTGLDLSAVDKYVANSSSKFRVCHDRLLSNSAIWTTLDYAQVTSPDVTGEVNLTCACDGQARGLVVWFESQLLDDIGFSNAPGEPPAIYGMQYFPLLQPTSVVSGDFIEVNLSANTHDDDYIWQWETQIHCGDTARLKAQFQQSSFHSAPLSLESLQKGSEVHVPQLDDEGRVDYFIMGQMRGLLSLGEIATKLIAEFPERFSSPKVALDRVAAVSKRYSD